VDIPKVLFEISPDSTRIRPCGSSHSPSERCCTDRSCAAIRTGFYFKQDY